MTYSKAISKMTDGLCPLSRAVTPTSPAKRNDSADFAPTESFDRATMPCYDEFALRCTEGTNVGDADTERLSGGTLSFLVSYGSCMVPLSASRVSPTCRSVKFAKVSLPCPALIASNECRERIQSVVIFTVS